MARSRAVSLLVAVVVGSLALGACGSSKKASGKTTTTSSSGGVTVPKSTGGTTVNATLGDTNGTDGPMTLTATPSSAAAGDVSITVKNTGTIDHEMVVLKTDTAVRPAAGRRAVTRRLRSPRRRQGRRGRQRRRDR